MNNDSLKNDFLLNIDSKNPNYQFLHIDVKEQYGIACKFKFDNNNPNNFQITHIKNVSYNRLIGKAIEYKVKIKNKTRKVSKEDYDFQIDIELTKVTGTEKDFNTKEDLETESDLGKFKHRCNRKKGENPKKEFIIDVKIKNKPFSFNEFSGNLFLQNNEKEEYKNSLESNEPSTEFDNFITFGTQFCRFVVD